MIGFEAAQLMPAESEERGLQAGEKGGTDDQSCGDQEQESDEQRRHSVISSDCPFPCFAKLCLR